MKKAVRVLSILGISVAALAAAGALSFWLLIIVGLSPKLQTIWICSAMRTMSGNDVSGQSSLRSSLATHMPMIFFW